MKSALVILMSVAAGIVAIFFFKERASVKLGYDHTIGTASYFSIRNEGRSDQTVRIDSFTVVWPKY
jgi:hypothetical protein